MPNHTAHVASARAPEAPRTDDALCVTCRIAAGRRHAHPRDHLGDDERNDCACPGHQDDAIVLPFRLTDWPERVALQDGCLGEIRERGPPTPVAA